MKKEWPTKSLGDVCRLISGQHIDAKDYNLQMKGTGHLTGPSDFGALHPVVSKWTEHPKITAERGDILLTVKGSGVGKVNVLSDDKVAISRQLMAVRVIGADPGFVYAFLSFAGEYFQSLSTGAAIPGISREQVLSLAIPFPPLPEQQRIVALLDEAFASIATAKANAERNLQNARAVFENHLAVTLSQWRVGWAETSLEAVVDPSCTLSYGIVQPGEDYLDGLPVVRPTDLVAKLIHLDGLKRIDPKLAEGYKRTMLQGGELLLCVRGSTGVASIAAPEPRGANVTRGIVPVRFNSALMLPELGYHLMKSEYVQSQIREKTYGAALMQINIRDLRTITLLVPSLKEQSVMALALSELDAEVRHLTHIYERKLAALEELKQSLLQQAFSGEL